MKTSPRTWFVTGINRGLGRCLAEHLLGSGDRVAGTSRDLAALGPLREKYGDRLWLASLDLTDVAQIGAVVNAAFAAHERIDAIVSNAGYSLLGAAEELTDAAIAHQIATNLAGPIHLARAALPHLRAHSGGRLLTVSSGAGHMGVPGLSLYCASKWGVEGFFESLSAEVAGFGVSVTLVEPGTMRTEFGSGAVIAEENAAYADGPVAMMRRAARAGYEAPVDPARCATMIRDSLEVVPAPLRLVLGADSYQYIASSLASRITSIEAQRDHAAAADFPRA